MNRTASVVLVAASLAASPGLLATPALSQKTALGADEAHDICTRPDMHWIDFCNGFAQAAADYAVLTGLACIPVGVTRTRLVELYEREAIIDPEFPDVPALILASRIYAKTYPCE